MAPGRICQGEGGIMRVGFDNEKYLKMQSEHIEERISKFGDKLYLEFGGKLFDDFTPLASFRDLNLTASSGCL